MYEFYAVLFFLLGLIFYLRWISPGAGLVFISYFGIAVIYPAFSNREYDPYTQKFTRFLDYESAPEALLILCVAFFITFFVYHMTRTQLRVKLNNTLLYQFRCNDVVINRIALVSILLSLVYILYSAMLYGGVVEAVFNSYKRLQSKSSASNFRSVIYWAAVVSSIYVTFYSNRMNLRTCGGVLVWSSIALSLILSLSNGGRSVLILHIFALFFPVVVYASIRKLISMAAIFLVCVFGISSLMIYARYSAQNATVGDRFSALEFAFTGLRYLDHFIISMSYADWNGFDFGELYINAAQSFIPRSLWSGKPELISAEVRYHIYGDYSGGIPPGLFGEGYISFGIIGVLVVGAAYGLMLAKLDSLIEKFRVNKDRSLLVLLGLFVPLLGFTFVRGGVDIGVFRLGLPFFWWFIIGYYLKRHNLRLVEG